MNFAEWIRFSITYLGFEDTFLKPLKSLLEPQPHQVLFIAKLRLNDLSEGISKKSLNEIRVNDHFQVKVRRARTAYYLYVGHNIKKRVLMIVSQNNNEKKQCH